MRSVQSDYVNFGDVARSRLGMQCQYASRYVTGIQPDTYPNLSEGLRFQNLEASSYHDIQIHQDDVEEFVHRVLEHRSS